MNVISGNSAEFKFKSTQHLFSAIKSDLEIFDQLGLIDESKYYRKIKRFLEELGTGIYKEKHGMILVENYRAYLLTDFNLLYAAYRCQCNSEVKNHTKHFQKGWSFWVEEESQKYNSNQCDLQESCWDEKINYRVRHYIGEEQTTSIFHSLVLLSVTNRSWEFCDNECLSMHCKSDDEISLDVTSNAIITNFESGFIYIQYWAFLYDENGLLLILDVAIIEGAVEDFIKYKIFEDSWINNSTQDIERKYLMLKEDSKKSKKLASYYISLLSFQNTVQYARSNRNKFHKFEMNKRRYLRNEILDNLNIPSMTNHLAFYNLYGGHSEIYTKR